MPKDGQHHYSEIYKKQRRVRAQRNAPSALRSERVPEGIVTHLRKRSYRWPEATENMLRTSSFFFSPSSFLEPPPVML